MLHTGIPEIIGNELNYSAMNGIENAWVIQHNNNKKKNLYSYSKYT